MAKDDEIKEKKFTTGEFRMAFPELFTPTEYDDDGKPKYRLTALVEPDSKEHKQFLSYARKAAVAEWGDKADKMLKAIQGTNHWPFVDGDEKEDLEGFEGKIAIRLSRNAAKGKPKVVNFPDREEIIDQEEIYPGCYGRAIVIACAYDNKKAKGIMFYLQFVQKTKDGDRFGGGGDASAEFDDGFTSDEDDETNYSKKSKKGKDAEEEEDEWT